MARKKRMRRNEYMEAMVPPLAVAGTGVGLSVLGGAVGDILPVGVSNPLTAAGSTVGRFVAPVGAISMGALALKKVSKLNKKVKKNRRVVK